MLLVKIVPRMWRWDGEGMSEVESATIIVLSNKPTKNFLCKPS